jgi:hypothetical protein
LADFITDAIRIKPWRLCHNLPIVECARDD